MPIIVNRTTYSSHIFAEHSRKFGIHFQIQPGKYRTSSLLYVFRLRFYLNITPQT